MSPTTPPVARPALLVTALCWLIVVFDGYDLIVYGTVVPRLLEEPGWELTQSSAGFLGSLAFLGMLLGALAAGALADRIGRRGAVLGCTVWFSVFTALCALAPSPGTFGAFRLLAGLGLGGLVPSANALVAEYASPARRSLVATLMMSGVPIGGSIAAVLGIWVIPGYGWRTMFAVALLALVVVLPLAVRWLPESPVWLRAKGRVAEAERIEARFGLTAPPAAPADADRVTAGDILRRPLRTPSVLFALATAATLFTWYGLGTWLPQLMRQSGYELGSALTFLLALNLGAVLGSLLTAYFGVRFGPARAAAVAALVACLALLGVTLATLPLAGLYGALVLAGIGTHGTQCLILAAIADRYPAAVRGAALGFALGVGRVGAVVAPQVGGWMLARDLGVDANFVVFAAVAAIAGLLLHLISRRQRADVTDATPEPTTPTVPAT
ncbi:AAHS family benzoate transporter-like MFS transporter [Barrientosiimonas humi]|uniref:AAHS family benzoate transporter-like MFS transporter n=1 Tax=Barrientosiimonas humi TaxID=999931 RepID=A0A542XAN3_9MICO|nr:MFS transporter [Barrientosiimonas humi]TQL32899.1 AAHS family benzoate transporter-like MFS transporter [Barrientosiimonas humi]CAG7572889.1 Gentisate transporter [Barrientosiimonas humi]